MVTPTGIDFDRSFGNGVPPMSRSTVKLSPAVSSKTSRSVKTEGGSRIVNSI